MLTADQLALRAHIQQANARFEPSCKASGATFYALPVDDPQHWAAVGITTVAQWDRAMMQGDFSDAFKSENGFRPDLSRYSEEEMRAWLARPRE